MILEKQESKPKGNKRNLKNAENNEIKIKHVNAKIDRSRDSEDCNFWKGNKKCIY